MRTARATIFIPSVSVAPKPEPAIPCGQNKTANEMAEILVNAAWQQRENMNCHKLLCKAAQDKAQDMADRNYFSHTSPSGITANENVKLTGYPLPYGEGNYVESIAGGYSKDTGNGEEPDVAKMFDALLNSPKHHAHITGGTNFFKKQDCFGVGFVYNKESVYGFYYVIVTAPCP